MSMYQAEHNSNQIPVYQHPYICQVSASLSLLKVGNALFSRGQAEDAMRMFDAAHVTLRSSVNVSALSKQLQWGQSQLLASPPCEKRDEMESSADTYHEDECDIGPRCFQTPMIPDEQCLGVASFVNTTHTTSTSSTSSSTDNTATIDATQITEAFILYNKSLVLHSKFDFLEAMRFYDATVQILTAFQGQLQHCSSMMIPNNNLHPTLSILGMNVHNNMGHIAYIEGAEDVAMSHFESALVFANKLCDATDEHLRLDIATVISNWCRLHWMSGDLTDHVYKGLREVLRIRSSILSSEHILVASAHYNLGVAEYARRRNEDAVSHLMQYLQVAALKGQQACMDDESKLDPIPALVYILLIKNEDKEDDAMAQELVRGLRTLQEKRSDLGPHDPLVASVLNYVGTVLFHQRDFDHSLLFFQEELRLEEALVEGSVDVSVAVTCNNIGRILQEQQRLPEAIRYYTRALQSEYGDEVLKMTVKSIKDQPANAAATFKAKSEILELPRSTLNLYSTIWYNLGLIHDRLGSFGEAIKSFQMSLALRRSMFGDDSADVACLMYNIAVLQMEQQLLTDATESFREALRIRRVAATGQLNDLHVVKTLQKLASLHKSKGNIEGALEACREILQIQEVSIDFDHQSRKKEMGTTLREISELYYAASNVEMAIAKARESVALLRELLGLPRSADAGSYVAQVEELFASLLLLGSLHHEKCEADLARALFAEASSIVQQASHQFSGPTAFDALHEVSQMLATCHCSPEA